MASHGREAPWIARAQVPQVLLAGADHWVWKEAQGQALVASKIREPRKQMTVVQIAWKNRGARRSHRSAPSPPGSPTSSLEATIARWPGVQRAPLEAWITPQLATLTDQAPMGDDWAHEIKYDGYRILARVKDHSAQLLSRNHHDWTGRLQPLAEAVAALPVTNAWLDGEVVAIMRDGSISFQALQNAFDTRSHTNLAYYVFDLLYLDGYDLRSAPLLYRKHTLAELLQRNTDGLIRYSDHVVGGGEIVFDQACQLGMEGIMSKRLDAFYRSGRSRYWLKVKCSHRQEFVIGGFTDPGGARSGFGALLLGVYDRNGHLHFAGKAGTGFTERTLKELHEKFSALKQVHSPFAESPIGVDARGVHWIKPELVAEVAFAEWTSEGILRQASFQGLREDKVATSVIKEEPHL